MGLALVYFFFFCCRYWADIGQPKDFLRGMHLHLKCLESKNRLIRQSSFDNANRKAPSPTLSFLRHDLNGQLTPRAILALPPSRPGVELLGNVLIDASAVIGEGSVIGPDVTIGANCEIGMGTYFYATFLVLNFTVCFTFNL